MTNVLDIGLIFIKTQGKRATMLSITRKFGGCDGSDFEIDEARETFPHGYVSWRWITCPCKVAAKAGNFDK